MGTKHVVSDGWYVLLWEKEGRKEEKKEGRIVCAGEVVFKVQGMRGEEEEGGFSHWFSSLVFIVIIVHDYYIIVLLVMMMSTIFIIIVLLVLILMMLSLYC